MKINYKKAKKKVFAEGTIPDGYFGERIKVDFALVGTAIVVVFDYGCFHAGLPDVKDLEEAKWILQHHKNAREIKAVKILDKETQ